MRQSEHIMIRGGEVPPPPPTTMIQILKNYLIPLTFLYTSLLAIFLYIHTYIHNNKCHH